MKRITSILIVLFIYGFSYGQDKRQTEEYNRSSLYTITLLHSGDRMFGEIWNAAQALSIPDKYNDHSLNLRLLLSDQSEGKVTSNTDENANKINRFLTQSQVGKRLVAKWFNRDKKTGAFDVETLVERGHYNISSLDLQKSMHTIEGTMCLTDADAELIPQTFVIVNDITYIDKEKNAQIAKLVFLSLAAAFSGVSASIQNNKGQDIANLAKSASELAASISDVIAGFTVDVRSYLFQLEWNPEISNKFYLDYFYDADHIDKQKKRAFESDDTSFQLKYIGTYNARSEKTSPRGLYAPEDVFRKVLARATDKNIVELQKRYEVFKVTSVITGISAKNEILVPIGLKEGVSAQSKYEVLERIIDGDKIRYVRRAIISPKKDAIWDNRYMAKEEKAQNANLEYTTFIIQSQLAPLYAGMLVREIK